MNNKKPRIFIGTREIAGYYYRLYKELKKQGYTVEYHCYYNPSEFVSISDYENILGKLTYSLTKTRYKILHRKKHKENILKKTIQNIYLLWIHILIEIISFLVLIYSIFKYDTFIFSFASSIVPYPYLIDLPILKLFGKRIISCVFHGSEARPRYISMYGIDHNNPTKKDLKSIYNTVKIQKKKLGKIEKYSDVVVGAYYTSHFLKKKFVNFYYIGIIPPTINQKLEEHSESKEKIIILHAPSKPEIKGTEKIKQAIHNLKQKYSNIEYLELTGKTNREVIEAIKKCDFIVDQLYSDTPLGGLATEGATYKKPSIVGGYIWEDSKKIHPQELFSISYLCHPSEIENAIEEFIKNTELRQKIAEQAYNFISQNWNPEIIASRFIKLIENKIPNEWFQEPITKYAHFCFTDEDKAKKILKLYLSVFGDKSLLLDDKPELKQKFIEKANS